jgi:hypothetical protein
MIGIKIAYYKKKDWSRFLSLIDDRESMHNNWHDWYTAFAKIKQDLIKEGFQVVEIEVDLDELLDYCRTRGLKNIGSTRSQFVQNK